MEGVGYTGEDEKFNGAKGEITATEKGEGGELQYVVQWKEGGEEKRASQVNLRLSAVSKKSAEEVPNL